MTYQRNRNRINYLNKEYTETHLNSQELVSSEYKSETNRKYYDREQIRMVDDVIYTLPDYTANRLKKEVYYICKNFRLKEIGSNYKTLIIDNNSLWKKYNLTWECYAKIITNLLIKTRENGRL